MLDGMENRIARLVFAIPAVKGRGVRRGLRRGKTAGAARTTTPFYMDGDQVKTRTNHAGGIFGGITTACPGSSGGGEAYPFHRPAPGQRELVRQEDTKLKSTAATTPCIVPGRCPAWRPLRPSPYMTRC